MQWHPSVRCVQTPNLQLQAVGVKSNSFQYYEVFDRSRQANASYVDAMKVFRRFFGYDYQVLRRPPARFSMTEKTMIERVNHECFCIQDPPSFVRALRTEGRASRRWRPSGPGRKSAGIGRGAKPDHGCVDMVQAHSIVWQNK